MLLLNFLFSDSLFEFLLPCPIYVGCYHISFRYLFYIESNCLFFLLFVFIRCIIVVVIFTWVSMPFIWCSNFLLWLILIMIFLIWNRVTFVFNKVVLFVIITFFESFCLLCIFYRFACINCFEVLHFFRILYFRYVNTVLVRWYCW